MDPAARALSGPGGGAALQQGCPHRRGKQLTTGTSAYTARTSCISYIPSPCQPLSLSPTRSSTLAPRAAAFQAASAPQQLRAATVMAAVAAPELPGALAQQTTAKLVLLGEQAAGKSSLVLRYVKGQFFDYQASTVGAAFLTKTIPELNIKFEIWDTAGQERYHSLAPMYYRGAAAAVIVYDITSADSFARAKAWVRELQRQGTPGMIMALAGNKADLEETRAVASEEAQAYANEAGLYFLETSAKTAANVNELFTEIARRLPKAEAAPRGAPQGGIVLDSAPAAGPGGARKSSACCA